MELESILIPLHFRDMVHGSMLKRMAARIHHFVMLSVPGHDLRSGMLESPPSPMARLPMTWPFSSTSVNLGYFLLARPYRRCNP
jgi:hypothetical protein